MDLNNLAQFLRTANKATYANQEAPKVTSTRLKSEDYHFEQDGLIYHDTYFGGRNFIGEEVVYENETPVWGANYYGFVIDEKVDTEEVYQFLRCALMQEHNDIIPVRGPAEFSMDNKKYTFIVNDDLSNFSGTEEILFENKIVYRCLLHGGLVR